MIAKKIFINLKKFFIGALDMQGRSINHLQNEIDNINDEFLILCYGDLLGLDIPTNYYALELLPYLANDLEKWEAKMSDAKSVWENRGDQLDFDL